MRRAAIGLSKPANLRRAAALLALAAVLLLTVNALGGGAAAQTGGPYDLSWWTVDGGGYTFSTGGGYTLGGTTGQPDAGVMSDSGGRYALSGGFWAVTGRYRIYLPLVLRGAP